MLNCMLPVHFLPRNDADFPAGDNKKQNDDERFDDKIPFGGTLCAPQFLFAP